MKTDNLKIYFIVSFIFHSIVCFYIASILSSAREAVTDNITPIEILDAAPVEKKSEDIPEPLPEKEIQKIKEEPLPLPAENEDILPVVEDIVPETAEDERVEEAASGQSLSYIAEEVDGKDAEVSTPLSLHQKRMETEKEPASEEKTIVTAPVEAKNYIPPVQEKKKGVEFVPLFKITRLPEFVRRIEAVYPESARKNNKEGVVILEVSIDSEGKVIEAKVIKGAGNDLDDAAIKSVKDSAFSPALSGDGAVAVKIRIPFRFELK
ncbi:MAG: energy transducer TonB [Nitrospinae bacterium]|nr:energy transducer TonB [Nitrospinota bacterium]